MRLNEHVYDGFGGFHVMSLMSCCTKFWICRKLQQMCPGDLLMTESGAGGV